MRHSFYRATKTGKGCAFQMETITFQAKGDRKAEMTLNFSMRPQLGTDMKYDNDKKVSFRLTVDEAARIIMVIHQRVNSESLVHDRSKANSSLSGLSKLQLAWKEFTENDVTIKKLSVNMSVGENSSGITLNASEALTMRIFLERAIADVMSFDPRNASHEEPIDTSFPPKDEKEPAGAAATATATATVGTEDYL